MIDEILLAEPRGFCAGVDRAIDIVEHALDKFGAPIYVRHEIVHNTHVVEHLKQRGAIFIEDLAEVPPNATLVFSAHGVPKAVHLALPEYYASRAELLSEFEVDNDTPIVFFSLRAPEDHRYLKGADAGYYVDFVGDYVGSYALGASLPTGNLRLDELLPALARHCPQAPTLPLAADGARPSEIGRAHV